MAFPTSSLTNNQVHKEGNRAFVYDSTLGVWDQVREADITDGKNLHGEIGGGVTFPSGHVLQTISTSMGDRLNIADTDPDSWIDIAGLSVQITPSSSSNKILVFASVKGNAGQSVACFLRTMRDSTAVGIGNTSGSRSRVSAALKEITAYDIGSTDWNFLDSPAATSTLTYKIQVYSNGDIVINGGTTTADNWSSGNAHSSITVMEIKA